jgi:hypothetical protein
VEIAEYVVSSPEKEHESLLVVGAEELARLKDVGHALAALKKAGKRAVLGYQLVWAEEGKARVEDLQDVLGLLDEARRKEFLGQLRFNEWGLGGSLNVMADAALLPSRRTAAEVRLTVRLR